MYFISHGHIGFRRQAGYSLVEIVTVCCVRSTWCSTPTRWNQPISLSMYQCLIRGTICVIEYVVRKSTFKSPASRFICVNLYMYGFSRVKGFMKCCCLWGVIHQNGMKNSHIPFHQFVGWKQGSHWTFSERYVKNILRLECGVSEQSYMIACVVCNALTCILTLYSKMLKNVSLICNVWLT